MKGRVIREAREALGLTQKQFAKKAKITQPYLSEIERNTEKNVSLPVIRRIAAASRGRLAVADLV